MEELVKTLDAILKVIFTADSDLMIKGGLHSYHISNSKLAPRKPDASR